MGVISHVSNQCAGFQHLRCAVSSWYVAPHFAPPAHRSMSPQQHFDPLHTRSHTVFAKGCSSTRAGAQSSMAACGRCRWLFRVSRAFGGCSVAQPGRMAFAGGCFLHGAGARATSALANLPFFAVPEQFWPPRAWSHESHASFAKVQVLQPSLRVARGMSGAACLPQRPLPFVVWARYAFGW